MRSYKQILNDITTFIFDVDGVLTDSTVTLFPDGSQIRKMNTRDGYALQLAVKKGFKVIVITGGKDLMVKKRLEGLGIKDIVLGAHDKWKNYQDYLLQYGLTSSEVLYMGDDVPDFQVMEDVVLAACPKDACSEIREISQYISHVKGGEGCVRDVIEQTLKVQGKWLEAETSQSI